MNISDTIIEGTFRQWEEGSVKSVMHLPGRYLIILVYILCMQWDQQVLYFLLVRV